MGSRERELPGGYFGGSSEHVVDVGGARTVVALAGVVADLEVDPEVGLLHFRARGGSPAPPAPRENGVVPRFQSRRVTTVTSWSAFSVTEAPVMPWA